MTSTPWARLCLEATEGRMITAMRDRMPRSPHQLNGVFEADAELLDLGDGGLLAVTVDTLHGGAELATAPTPYAKGWLTTTAGVSDLAAVAADPAAVLVSCSLRRTRWTVEDAGEFGRGAAEAASRYGCHIAGGDTNWAGEDSFTACVVGTARDGRFLRRTGAQPGDALYVTGRVGAGNAAGLRGALGETGGPPWLPEARVVAGEALRAYARAAVDTSDGLMSAAVTLAEVNGLGVEVTLREEVYDPVAAALADAHALPRWFLAAGEWGEFELLYAVAPADAERCARALSGHGLAAIQVGQLTAAPQLRFADEAGTLRELPDVLPRMRAVDPTGALLPQLRALAAGAK